MKDGDFDFNVVIRSLEYSKNRLKYCVGGAITYDSLAEEEYEECLTKASGIMNLLEKVSNSNQVD
jgi:para-aminobenzoate synthetase component 1